MLMKKLSNTRYCIYCITYKREAVRSQPALVEKKDVRRFDLPHKSLRLETEMQTCNVWSSKRCSARKGGCNLLYER